LPTLPPKLGISRAKTQRPQRSEIDGEELSQNCSSFRSELGVLGVLAQIIPRVQQLKITGKFLEVAQMVKDSNIQSRITFD
jgi:hypothetical protein